VAIHQLIGLGGHISTSSARWLYRNRPRWPYRIRPSGHTTESGQVAIQKRDRPSGHTTDRPRWPYIQKIRPRWPYSQTAQVAIYTESGQVAIQQIGLGGHTYRIRPGGHTTDRPRWPYINRPGGHTGEGSGQVVVQQKHQIWPIWLRSNWPGSLSRSDLIGQEYSQI